MEINKNQWKSMKSLILSSSRQRQRSPGAARVALYDQTQALTCAQCPRMTLEPSRRLGECLRDPNSGILRFATDCTKYLDISSIKKKHDYILVVPHASPLK